MIRPRFLLSFVVLTMLLSFPANRVMAQLVPGSGTLHFIDDFEDPEWSFSYNHPKSSKEEDEQVRFPLGVSANRKWMEGPKRGTPDLVKRVPAPEGALPGSTAALLLRSKDTGIPGRPSYSQKQDDLVIKSRSMSVGSAPQVVVRVYLPDWDKWENRHGVALGIRMGMQGPQEKHEDEHGIFRRNRRRIKTIEPYYPGFFIQFNPKEHPSYDHDHALLLIRANEYGQDIPGPRIEKTGWWTFGMSVTPDARVHYYAKPGVEDLTAADHLTSTLPYSIPGTGFNTLFFNICSGDNTRSWSTPFIIDDPQIFYGTTKSRQPRQQITNRQSGSNFRR